MDPHSFIARAEAQRWLGIAEKLLMSHDLVGSKTFAIRARDSDPRLEAADQILAIADTLLAAEKPVVGNNGAQQPDFYAILQLVRFVQDTDHIASQYRRLAVMLNPHQNRFPYSEQAFQLVNDAWGVLSNPMRKSIYDSEIEFPPQQQMNTLGFNLEHQQHHHHQQQHHHHHQHQQQQQQHNFFSINHMGSGHEQELAEPPQTFQSRVQHSHQHQQLQQHNFLSQPNPVRSHPVREQEQLFQHREQEQLFQPQVQPFQVTSAPQQQTRPSPQPPQPHIPMRQPTPPPQPPQPQPSIQSPTPPPPAAPPQPPFSWPQAPPLSQPHTQQQQQQHLQPQPFSQPKPQPQQPLSQPQPQSHPQPHALGTSQPQPHSQSPPEQQLQQKQPNQQLQQEQEQEESLEQNAAPVELPSEVNGNNGVRDEELERETEEAAEDVDDGSPTFWTACPFCFYMYEYPKVYAECTLRCDNCKRAFQAVRVPSPPPIIEGQEACFYCWGFFPVGVSMSHLEKNNGKGTSSKWTPFSPLCEASSNVQDHLNGRAAPKENLFVNKSSGPRIYIDDITDDVFMGISEPSDDSDAEWDNAKEKVKRMKKALEPSFKMRAQVLAIRARDARNGSVKDLQDAIPVQEVVGVATVPVAESSKKAVGSNPRRQSGRVAKELGKLDLNVEFNNNEGEEPAPRMTVGNRGHGHGEEDNIEGIGFFEGLDEFLSSLPILSVVNEEKVKAA